jgi:hypothetical protein
LPPSIVVHDKSGGKIHRGRVNLEIGETGTASGCKG